MMAVVGQPQEYPSRYSSRIGLKSKTLNVSGKSDPGVIFLCLKDEMDSLFLRRVGVLGGKASVPLCVYYFGNFGKTLLGQSRQT